MKLICIYTFFMCSLMTQFQNSAPLSTRGEGPGVRLKHSIDRLLQQQHGDFAVAFKDIKSGHTLFINEHEIFHAASTMKTPVLIEIFKQARAGRFALSDSIVIKNEFTSIADSSRFTLNADDDSETDLYKHIGEKRAISDLAYLMITLSSNLSTNMLIELVHAKNVTQTMRRMGAKDLQVLRGVEDGKAYEKGLNNVVTAYDLMRVFEKIAMGKAVSSAASEAMIRMLTDQHFNEIIPAGLPANTRVAHKTGWFKGVNHDSGIIFLPDGRKYILILLSKNADDDKASVKALSAISEMIYKYEMGE